VPVAMPCGLRGELVDAEQFGSPSNVDAVQLSRHRNPSAHARVRTRTPPPRTKPVGQLCCELHRPAVAGALDWVCSGGVHESTTYSIDRLYRQVRPPAAGLTAVSTMPSADGDRPMSEQFT
jgi:hypothetical protein